MAASNDSTEDPKEFYGYLFNKDKGPTEMMRELLTGIGKYIIQSIGEPTTHELTPPKLAEFYKLVGGNYDPVFLDPPSDRLSFIYTSIGCQHTLQPGPSDYLPPTIPALTLKGFIRWQSIETLLGPEEHVPYLQFAVANFEILRKDGTTRFPELLPAECLPSKPDEQVMRWHEECSKRLWREYITPNQTPRGSPRPRSHTGPPAGTPADNERYKYAYAHVKLPGGNGFSAQSSPRMRAGGGGVKEREDYFNSKPVPGRRSRPSTAENNRRYADGGGGTGQRRSSPEDSSDLFSRGRRRSVPKNYYSGLDGSDIPNPGRATSHPASPTDRRPHSESFGDSAKDYARRHSHPKHKYASVETESSDEEGEADPDANIPRTTGPPSPQYSSMRAEKPKPNIDIGGSAHRLSAERVARHNSKTAIPDFRYEAASPIATPTREGILRESRRGSHVVGEMGRVASNYGNSYARAHSGLDVPTMGGNKARIYKVHSADEKGDGGAGRGLRHKGSLSSGGSRSGSRDDLRGELRAREGRRSGAVRFVKEVIGDALPFSHRRHSDSPPGREREEMRRREGGASEKYRTEDVAAMGRAERREKERSSDEERRKARKVREREEMKYREMVRDRELASGGGRRRPEVERRF